MRIPITRLDSVGLIKDAMPHEAPLAAWSDVINMRFQAGAVEKIGGEVSVFTPQVVPVWTLPVRTLFDFNWIYASNTRVYVWDGASSFNLTKQVNGLDVDYAGGVGKWNGGVLNGIPVLNNGTDIPQVWNPVNTGVRLSDLPNWPATWRCKVLKPFKNFLVALNLTKNGTRYPQLVAWSHPADPGTVPSSWDQADTSKDAGEVALADTPGEVVDAVPLRDANIIYKDDTAYLMQHTDSPFIFRFSRIMGIGGALAANCVQHFSFRGDKHLVLGTNDVYWHDGTNSESILTDRIRKWLFSTISAVNFKNSFLTVSYENSEIWICFPKEGSVYANLALIWNWRTNTFTLRELNNIVYGTDGIISVLLEPDIWNTDDRSWDSDDSVWNSAVYSPARRSTLFLGVSGTVMRIDDSFTFNGVSYRSMCERNGISVVGVDRQGNPIVDTEVVKLLREVWLRVDGPIGRNIDVYVSGQMDRNSPVLWKGPYPFKIGTDKKVNVLVTGKSLGVRFESTGDFYWRLSGYDIDIVRAGAY